MTKLLGQYTPKEYTEKLLSDLLKHKIGVEEGKGGPDYDDFVLRLDGYIEIYEKEDIVVSETLTGPVKGTGYEIGRVKCIHNYPFEPDDYDYEGENEEPSLLKAIWCAVKMAMEDEFHRAVEGISETAYAAELKEHY